MNGADTRRQLVVLGAGPGGYTAAFRAADLGMKVTLVERWPELGGVCLNVGCIPSKALLHAARIVEEARDASEFGVEFGRPAVDPGKLMAWKARIVGQLTQGLAGLARRRGVEVVTGTGRFSSAHTLEVRQSGGARELRFEQCIVAAGSEPIRLPGLPDDPRIMDSTGALEIGALPDRLLVVGGGIIGLEMATVYAALGVAVSVVELTETLIPGCDRDLVKPLEKRVSERYEAIMPGTRVTGMDAREDGIAVRFAPADGLLRDGAADRSSRDGVADGSRPDDVAGGLRQVELVDASRQREPGRGRSPRAGLGPEAPVHEQVYDRVLVAVGRKPNGDRIDADRAGLRVDERGFIGVDRQMRTNVPHIFAIGDIVGEPLLAHKAAHEGKVAAEVAAGEKSWFDARAVPSVAYTDPEIAWAGLSEASARAEGVAYAKGVFPWAASGRSLTLGRSEGLTKLLFDEATGRLLGAGMVGPNAGDLIAEAVLAIEMGCDAEDISLSVHAHPTLSETVAFAAEAAAGTITDLYIPKRRKRAG